MKRRDFLAGMAAAGVVGAMGTDGMSAGVMGTTHGAEPPDAGDGTRWYRGGIHHHTLWSDGDAAAEVVVSMAREMGYDFFAITDHSVFANTERWRTIDSKVQAALDQAEERGDPILGEIREITETSNEGVEETKRQVRLAKFDELDRTFSRPGEFLLIPSEELDRAGVDPDGRRTSIHMNIFNITQTVPKASGAPPTEEAIRDETRRLQKIGADEGRLVAVQLNHPTWPWFDNRAEEIAAVDELTLLEPFNLTPTTNRLGTKEHESADRIWDIANTLRLSSGRKPIFATASDDSHNYRDFSGSSCPPGRGWVMVRAKELTVEAILTAMLAGDFYATGGVILRTCHFDPKTRKLTVEVDPKPDTKYTIRFIGTKKDCTLNYEEVPAPDREGKPGRPNRKYADGVGTVLAEVEGTRGEYTLSDEWYVRAHIISDRTMSSPPNGESTVEEAWTQPVM